MLDKNKLFTPLSIENTTSGQSGYFFSARKGVLIVLGFIPGIFWIPLCSSVTIGSAWGILFGLISFTIYYIYFLRFIVMEETNWKKIFKKLYENKMSNIDHFWDIDTISKRGIINYRYTAEGGVRKAMIIKLISSSKIGKGEDYKQDYQDNMKRIIHNLLREGCEIQIYETRESKEVPENLKSFYNNMKKIEDPLTKEIVLEHINNVAKITRSRKKLESMYIVVYITDVKKFKRIESERRYLESMCSQGKYFKEVKTLNREEILDFIAKILCINVINRENLNKSKIEEFRKYGEIYRVFDDKGNEEWLDIDNMEEEIEEREEIEDGEDREDDRDIVDITEEMREEFNRKINQELEDERKQEELNNDKDLEELIERSERELYEGDSREDKRRLLIKELVLRRNMEEIGEKNEDADKKIKKLEELRKSLIKYNNEEEI